MLVKPIRTLSSIVHGFVYGVSKSGFKYGILVVVILMFCCTSKETLKRNSDFASTFQLTDKIMTEGLDFLEKQEQGADSVDFEGFVAKLKYWMVLSGDAEHAIKTVNREYPGDPLLDSVNSLAPAVLSLHRSVDYIAYTWLFSQIYRIGTMGQMASASIADGWNTCIEGGLDYSILIPKMAREIREAPAFSLEIQIGQIRDALVAWAPSESSSSGENKTYVHLEELFLVSSELLDHAYYPSGSLLDYQTHLISLVGKLNRTKERFDLERAKLLK